MRTEKENMTRREATFKASKKTRYNKKKSKSCSCSSCSDDSYYEEEENFVRKLKRGARKYKGKLPFKYFNCGKIGHFASKCPYAKILGSDEENENKYQKMKKKFVKIKSIYSKEDNSSSDEDNGSDDDLGNVILMDLD